MKTLVYFLIAAAMVPAVAGAGPKIKFDKMSHDFGDIEKGTKVHVDFPFTNTGDEALVLDRVTTSCGCTSAELTQKSFAPGESGKIPVTFDPDRFENKITKRIEVNSNDASTPKVTLTIEANILVDVVATPESLFIAKALPHEVTTGKIVVHTPRMAHLTLKNLKIEPEYLTVTQEQVDEKTVNLLVAADGSKFPKGKTRLSGYLTYDTNSSSQASMRGNVTINVEQPIRIVPGALYFYASKIGKSRQTNLLLEATSGEAFKILGMASDIPFIEVQTAEDNGKQKTLTVTLTDKAPEGKFQGFITLTTDVAGQKEVVVSVRGSVTP